jgi:hypothetical protein
MERARARRQIEPQLRNLRGSLQLNSSQLITFETFRAFVAEGTSQPATESSLDYLLFVCWLLPQRRQGKHYCLFRCSAIDHLERGGTTLFEEVIGS